ncbi:DNA-processing protein DprA [Fodinibacter luteus]|uniref:DNA-processing protein DprA n=1 Tax=Fodinibacter luteus TaxID=552064 RepID=A0ABP8K7B9_9MICO
MTSGAPGGLPAPGTRGDAPRRGRAPRGREGDERWARVAWSFLGEPKDPELGRLIGELGAVETLARLREGRLSDRMGWGARLPDLDVDGLAHVVAYRRLHVLVPGDPGWPDGVDRLEQPPYCLYVRGEPDLAGLVDRGVAVVGSRAATEYGLRVAADLAEGLASRGFTVISGAAYGIDSAAHRASLAVGGSTVAVLACGADRAYPSVHRTMLDEIARTAAVVSEVPPGCAPYRSRFLARNRVIATLARATVVVEANLRSGSLTTAKAAREHHLPVGAVPGPVTSMASAGCHALVRDTDAVLVTDAAEVAELAARIGEHLLPGLEDAGRLRRPADDLDPTSYAVWSAVPVRGGVTAERLAAASGVEPRRLVAILGALEVRGLVRREAGRWRKAGQATGAPAG